MKRLILSLIALIGTVHFELTPTLHAQNVRDYIRRGNRHYRDSVYDKAQVQYQKGFELDSNNVQIRYNLGNALLFQGQPKDAMAHYEKAAALERNPARLHQIYHNMGVILQSQKQFPQAIQAYVKALAYDPKDHESRYNLVVCQYQLEKNPQNQGGGDDKEQQDKDKQKQQQQQQQQKQDQQKKDEQQQQQQQQPKNEMSKENAEQMLNAAMQNERQTQDKVKKQMQQGERRRLQKQW
ncbi:MAG: tetratricopeptide repeat protein [Bacteroidaceae bacterium]|nr:tetratricopeptide repeat protein [Bacteroidaceae bacterium]